MEAAIMFHHPSPDQPISPYKASSGSIRNPRKNINHPLNPRSSENFCPPNFHSGLLQAPHPHLSRSFPPFSVNQQPPLLPLPFSQIHNMNNTNNIHPPAISRVLSCPPVNRKNNNNKNTRSPRDSSLTPKKSKPSTKSPKKVENLKPATKVASDCAVIPSVKPLGPEPKDLPKDITKTLLLSGNSNLGVSSQKSVQEQVDKFSGSVVFTLSPPPSSLPLPTFSLRPKLSCNAEAAGIDAGATDNLRRLLRLP